MNHLTDAHDETYDPTPPAAQRLTDQRAGYGEPSEGARQIFNSLEYIYDYDATSEQIETEVCRALDAFAAQAVAAREAEIVAALDEWRKPAIFGAEEARRKNRYDLKREFDLVAQAYDKAIDFIRKP